MIFSVGSASSLALMMTFCLIQSLLLKTWISIQPDSPTFLRSLRLLMDCLRQISLFWRYKELFTTHFCTVNLPPPICEPVTVYFPVVFLQNAKPLQQISTSCLKKKILHSARCMWILTVTKTKYTTYQLFCFSFQTLAYISYWNKCFGTYRKLG